MAALTTKSPFLAIIVEDDTELAIIFSTAFREAGFVTEMIEAGDMALARIAAKEPAIVLLDLHLPYLSGDEVLTQIRNQARLANTQVILATSDLVLAEQLRGAADLVLIKPVGYEKLCRLAVKLYAEIASNYSASA